MDMVSLSTHVELAQCMRPNTSYLAMSYVCNLIAICLEDVETSQVGLY
jgi:hypothetical protein